MTEKPPGFLSANYKKLLEDTCDTQLKAKSVELSLDIFWGNLLEEYPEI